MAKEAVQYGISANASKAVAEHQKVISQHDRLIGQLRKTAGESRKGASAAQTHTRAMQGIGGAIKNIAVGLMGGMGLTAGIAATIQQFREMRQEAAMFEDEMSALLSLGGNIENIGAIKEQVLGMSNALGMTRKEIADTLFSVQSGASNLSKTLRDDVVKEAIELSRVTGTDLNMSLTALLKTFLIYGDTLKDVNDAQNKVLMAEEKGWLTFEDVARNLPDVIAPAKALGYSLDEVLGALIIATQKGGRTEKTFTGLRNVFLKMNEAIEGTKTKAPLIEDMGSFAKNIEALSTVDIMKIKELFGVDAITAISNLAQNFRDLGEAINEVRRASGDIAGEKLARRFEDIGYIVSQEMKAAEQFKKNIGAQPEYIEQWGHENLKYQVRLRGARQALPSVLQWLAPVLAGYESILEPVAKQRFLTPGVETRVKELQRVGQGKQAEVLERDVHGFGFTIDLLAKGARDMADAAKDLSRLADRNRGAGME